VPSFVNELSRKVSIHRTIWFPVIFCTIIYIVLGILGAASYKISNTSNILATMSDSGQGTAIGILSIVMNVLFPLSVLISSIPIFSIVIRYNLIRGRICSRGNSPNSSISIQPLSRFIAELTAGWALFWAAFFPWLLVIPFQTMVPSSKYITNCRAG
jgi:hypothetical protein